MKSYLPDELAEKLFNEFWRDKKYTLPEDEYEAARIFWNRGWVMARRALIAEHYPNQTGGQENG
jgi:hypothetical protein